MIKGADYPDGVKILARATSSDPKYRESTVAVKAISGKFFDLDITWNTIFVLDTSGSMVTNNRLARLQAQVVSVLQEFGEDDKFAIIEYDSAASVISPWGTATESRKQEALAAVSNLTANGATNYHAACRLLSTSELPTPPR